MSNAAVSYLRGQIRNKYEIIESGCKPDEKQLALHDIKEIRKHIEVIKKML